MSDLSIRIKIANREYPMKVKVEDEAMVRRIGKEINEKIKIYQSQFGIDDKQDLLAMVTFDTMVENMKSSKATASEDESVLKQLKQMNDLMSSKDI